MFLYVRKANLIVPMIITIMILFRVTIVHAEFDLKTRLLAHREQHTNHLNKEFVYSHFRRLDESRIQKLQQLIAEQERRLQNKEVLVHNDEYNNIYRSLNTAKTRLTSLLSESHKETEERYAELHESIQSEHTLGLADLDFTRTGL